MRKFIFAVLALVSLQLSAQDFDTVRVMTYNLMYYGQVTSFCTTSNNPVADKDGYLKTVAHHVNPDLLVVNEMGASDVYGERILVNSLNTDGVNKYARINIQNNSFSDLVNGIFYNKNKFAVYTKTKVSKNLNNSDIVRVIDVVTFYYKDPNLAEGSDTVFIHLLAAHLKAGSTTSDESSRGAAAEAVMNFMQNNLQPGYFMICGDMNLKGSSESAYQQFTNSSYGNYRFLDPINQPGNWNNSGTFASIHTQSTHSSGNSCFSGGGLDDRFDLILMSGQVVQDTGKVSYVEGSYHAVGQDGLHFNQDVNAGTNLSAPTAVLNALYNMSDHLPVAADLKIALLPADTTWPEGIIESAAQNQIKIWAQNGELRLDNKLSKMPYQVLSISGMMIEQGVIESGYQTISIPDQTGIYILRFDSEVGVITKKIAIID